MPRRHDSSLLDEVGARVARIRRERRMSQGALAAKVGVEPESISRCETGASSLSLSNLVRVSQALGVSLGDLLDGARPVPAAPERPDVVELVRLYDGLDDGGRMLVMNVAREVARAWTPRTTPTAPLPTPDPGPDRSPSPERPEPD